MSDAPSIHLQVGYVARAHGLQGEVAVRTFDPSSEVLLEVQRAHLRRRDGQEEVLEILEARPANKEILLMLEGLENRAASESRVGATVSVFREDLEAPAEGEYFLGDLLGLQACDEAGTEVGKVEEVWTHGEVPTLVVRGGAAELLLPFVEPFVSTVDLVARKVIVRPASIAE